VYRMLLALLAVVAFSAGASAKPNDERAVRELIERWDAAYRSLDAKALAALETEDFELVDRFGWWTKVRSREQNGRMWAWVFESVYRRKPGPKHTIESVRFVSSEVAIVQASADWPALTLPDGTAIPPHGEIITFVVVKQKKTWLIASQNTHNQMPGDEPPSPLPWEQRAAPGDGEK